MRLKKYLTSSINSMISSSPLHPRLMNNQRRQEKLPEMLHNLRLAYLKLIKTWQKTQKWPKKYPKTYQKSINPQMEWSKRSAEVSSNASKLMELARHLRNMAEKLNAA